MAQLEPGDTLVVSAMSRMGRTTGEVITTVDALLKQQVRFLEIKEDIRLVGEQDVHSMMTLFGRFAEIAGEIREFNERERGEFDKRAQARRKAEIRELRQRGR